LNDSSVGIDSSAAINALYLLKGGTKQFEVSYDTSGVYPIFRLLPYQVSSVFQVGNPANASNSNTDYIMGTEPSLGNLKLGRGIPNGAGDLAGAATSDKVQINGNMYVSGSVNVKDTLTAAVKNFKIPHQEKPGFDLVHSVLEGPEIGVYVRGKVELDNTIELPDYWTWLVDESTISVQLTPIGSPVIHYVVEIKDNKVVINSESGVISCFYTIYAERKDVDKLIVERDQSTY